MAALGRCWPRTPRLRAASVDDRPGVSYQSIPRLQHPQASLRDPPLHVGSAALSRRVPRCDFRPPLGCEGYTLSMRAQTGDRCHSTHRARQADHRCLATCCRHASAHAPHRCAFAGLSRCSSCDRSARLMKHHRALHSSSPRTTLHGRSIKASRRPGWWQKPSSSASPPPQQPPLNQAGDAQQYEHEDHDE